MFNVTGGELLLILVMALIVLGPERLPDAARQLGKALGQLRDISGSFQREIRDAFEEPSPPVVKPKARPQLTAIDGGARPEASPVAAAPVDGGESLAVAETAAAQVVPPAIADVPTGNGTAPDTAPPPSGAAPPGPSSVPSSSAHPGATEEARPAEAP
jgi:sec-independent protein translocase protein TatB